MNERWLVTAFQPRREERPRHYSQKVSQAAGHQDLLDLYAVMFRKLEAQSRRIIVRILAASRKHGLHGPECQGRRSKWIFVGVELDECGHQIFRCGRGRARPCGSRPRPALFRAVRRGLTLVADLKRVTSCSGEIPESPGGTSSAAGRTALAGFSPRDAPLFKHLPDLAVAAFDDRYFEPRIVAFADGRSSPGRCAGGRLCSDGNSASSLSSL